MGLGKMFCSVLLAPLDISREEVNREAGLAVLTGSLILQSWVSEAQEFKTSLGKSNMLGFRKLRGWFPWKSSKKRPQDSPEAAD